MSVRHLRAETTSRMLPTSVHGPRSARAQGTDAEFGLSMRGGAGCVVLDPAMDLSEYLTSDATTLAGLVAEKDVTAVELLALARQRCDAVNP